MKTQRMTILSALAALLALAPGTRAAAAESRPFLVGVDAGVAIPYTELETTFHVEIEAGYRFALDQRLGAGLTFGYSRPTTEGKVTYTADIDAGATRTPATVGYETTLDELVLSVDVFFRLFDDDTWWTPWISLGPAFFFLRHEVSAFGQTNTETGTLYGLLGVVGADFQLGPGAITARVRLPWAPVDNKTLGDETKGVGAVTIQVGYRFFF